MSNRNKNVFVLLQRAKNEELEAQTKPREERMQKLKQQNAELAAIAKRLEEKSKSLQKQQNSKV